jgi:hypothetical protein
MTSQKTNQQTPPKQVPLYMTLDQLIKGLKFQAAVIEWCGLSEFLKQLTRLSSHDLRVREVLNPQTMCWVRKLNSVMNPCHWFWFSLGSWEVHLSF